MLNAYSRLVSDLRMCHVRRYTNPDGSTILVNHVPQLHVLTYTFNKYSPPDTSFYTLSVASYLMSEAVTKQLLLDPSTGSSSSDFTSETTSVAMDVQSSITYALRIRNTSDRYAANRFQSVPFVGFISVQK